MEKPSTELQARAEENRELLQPTVNTETCLPQEKRR